MTRRLTPRRGRWRRVALGFGLGAVVAGGCRTADPTPPVPLTNAPPGTVAGVAPTALLPPPLRGRVRVGGGALGEKGQPPDSGSSTPHPNPPPQGAKGPEVAVQPVGFSDGPKNDRDDPPAEPKKSEKAGVEPSPAVPAPPTVPADAELPIDLGSALRLAGADNPTIGLAREVVREAAARQLAARALLLPSLNAGANVRFHRGAIQRSSGFIDDVTLRSVYAGLGAYAVGSNSVFVPGVWLLAHLGDAAYEPLAARQRVAVRASEARAVNNSVLLDAAAAYLDLLGAEARAESLRESEGELAEVARLTRVYAEAGQGRAGDANRAAANADLFRRQVQQADEDVATASARLARLLSLDPSARLRTPGGPVAPVPLVDENQELAPLAELALRGRPEVAARGAAVGEAQVRVRQEKVRPWLPTLSVGFSGGQFGGGGDQAGYAWSPGRSRTDFDVAAYWTAQNLGAGNLARTRAADGVLGQAVADLERVRNQVRDEVAEAKAAAQSAAGQVRVATAALGTAEEGFRLERARIKQGEGLPLEVLDSFRQLADARLDLIRASVGYNQAQFRLLVALGNAPAAE